MILMMISGINADFHIHNLNPNMILKESKNKKAVFSPSQALKQNNKKKFLSLLKYINFLF